MTEPHLILHKVRGEPAFDIAVLIGEDSDGPLWIIPTSGHRAYPYWHISVNEINPEDRPPMPPDHPDHYSTNDLKPRLKAAAKPLQHAPTLTDLEALLS